MNSSAPHETEHPPPYNQHVAPSLQAAVVSVKEGELDIETSTADQARDELCLTLLQVVKEIHTQQTQLSETVKDMTRGSHTKFLTRDTPT